MKLRKILAVLLAVMMVLSTFAIVTASAESEVTNNNPYSVAAMELDELYAYDGDDLGSTYTPEATTFKVWSPTSEAVTLKLYDTGTTTPIFFYQAEVPEAFGKIASIEPVRFYSGVGGWPAKIDNYFVKVYEIK